MIKHINAIDMFATPKNINEVQDWIDKHSPDERAHLYTATMMTWNLMCGYHNDHVDQLQDIVDTATRSNRQLTATNDRLRDEIDALDRSRKLGIDVAISLSDDEIDGLNDVIGILRDKIDTRGQAIKMLLTQMQDYSENEIINGDGTSMTITQIQELTE